MTKGLEIFRLCLGMWRPGLSAHGYCCDDETSGFSLRLCTHGTSQERARAALPFGFRKWRKKRKMNENQPAISKDTSRMLEMFRWPLPQTQFPVRFSPFWSKRTDFQAKRSAVCYSDVNNEVCLWLARAYITPALAFGWSIKIDQTLPDPSHAAPLTKSYYVTHTHTQARTHGRDLFGFEVILPLKRAVIFRGAGRFHQSLLSTAPFIEQ